MASERQLQDRGNSTQEDSLGIQDAQQITDPAVILTLSTNSDSTNDRKHLQQVDLLTKKLQTDLNSVVD